MLRFQAFLFNDRDLIDDEVVCCWLMSGANGRFKAEAVLSTNVAIFVLASPYMASATLLQYPWLGGGSKFLGLIQCYRG